MGAKSISPLLLEKYFFNRHIVEKLGLSAFSSDGPAASKDSDSS